MVLFSNLSSPEYILDLQARRRSGSGHQGQRGERGGNENKGARRLPGAPHLLPPWSQHSPQDRQAPGTDILAAMLDPRDEVGQELVNGAFVLDGA